MMNLKVSMMIGLLSLTACSRETLIEYQPICTNPNLIKPIVTCDQDLRECQENIISLGDAIILRDGVIERCTSNEKDKVQK